MKYTFPIVITHDPQEAGPQYLVSLPDFDSLTQGESLADAIEVGQDLVSILVVQLEDENKPMPEATPLETLIVAYPDATATLMVADTDAYRKLYNSKPTKKTLTIPTWLNTKAEEEGINFSQTLQDALKDRLVL